MLHEGMSRRCAEGTSTLADGRSRVGPQTNGRRLQSMCQTSSGTDNVAAPSASQGHTLPSSEPCICLQEASFRHLLGCHLPLKPSPRQLFQPSCQYLAQSPYRSLNQRQLSLSRHTFYPCPQAGLEAAYLEQGTSSSCLFQCQPPGCPSLAAAWNPSLLGRG